MALVLCNNFFNGKTSFMDKEGREWLLPNTIGFNAWVNKEFKKYTLKSSITTNDDEHISNNDMLFPHQEFIREFMRPGSPYRGLCVYHGLGSGKTRTSILMSEQFRALGYKIIFVSPAALSSNMVDELGKWGNQDVRNITDSQERLKYLKDKKLYEFVSINGTPINKFKNIDLEDKVIIIDEVHNLGSVISNKINKKAAAFYEWLMGVKNCKILALSGSPIINDPFEIALISNILRGPMDYETELLNKNTIKDYKSVFPHDREQFISLFINKETNKLKNELIFKRRITGLFSYFYGIVGAELPVLETILEEVPMSNDQYKMYAIARKYEISIDKNYNKDKDDSNSSYRNYSRQISNFVIPVNDDDELSYKELAVPENYDDWTKEQQENLAIKIGNVDSFNNFVTSYKQYDSVEEKIDALKEYGNDFVKEIKDAGRSEHNILKFLNSKTSSLLNNNNLIENLQNYSPKLKKVFENIEKGKGNKGKVFIYSHYRNYSGIGIIKELLKQLGYEEINENNVDQFDPNVMTENKRYGFFVGGVNNEIRYKIKEIYNHPNNMHGELMKIFMGTSAAAEGISLKQVQQVHIIEPYWNNVRIQQVIGRARRLGSHIGLPSEEQTVYAYMYFSVFPTDQEDKIEKDTTDTHIYENSLKKQQLNDQFLKAIKSSAVDCTLNYAQNSLVDKEYVCYVPDPDNTKEIFAWDSDINADIKRLEGIEIDKTIVKNKYLPYPRPHHINLFKIYNEKLYEPKNTIFSGTIENISNGRFTFTTKMKLIRTNDYYKDFYVHVFSQQQKGYIISSYDFANKTLTVSGLSSENIEVGTRFWIYRPKYVAKIVNNDVYKEDNAVVLYDRNELMSNQQWVPKIGLVLSSDERDATFKMF